MEKALLTVFLEKIKYNITLAKIDITPHLKDEAIFNKKTGTGADYENILCFEKLEDCEDEIKNLLTLLQKDD